MRQSESWYVRAGTLARFERATLAKDQKLDACFIVNSLLLGHYSGDDCLS
jgi:hypothetical protein